MEPQSSRLFVVPQSRLQRKASDVCRRWPIGCPDAQQPRMGALLLGERAGSPGLGQATKEDTPRLALTMAAGAQPVGDRASCSEVCPRSEDALSAEVRAAQTAARSGSGRRGSRSRQCGRPTSGHRGTSMARTRCGSGGRCLRRVASTPCTRGTHVCRRPSRMPVPHQTAGLSRTRLRPRRAPLTRRGPGWARGCSRGSSSRCRLAGTSAHYIGGSPLHRFELALQGGIRSGVSVQPVSCGAVNSWGSSRDVHAALRSLPVGCSGFRRFHRNRRDVNYVALLVLHRTGSLSALMAPRLPWARGSNRGTHRSLRVDPTSAGDETVAQASIRKPTLTRASSGSDARGVVRARPKSSV